MKADADDFNDAVESFFGLLCAAEGELSVQEIRSLLGQIPRLPEECARWLSVAGARMAGVTVMPCKPFRFETHCAPWFHGRSRRLSCKALPSMG